MKNTKSTHSITFCFDAKFVQMFILIQFLIKTVSDGDCVIETITPFRQVGVFTRSLITSHFKLTLISPPARTKMLSHKTVNPYIKLTVSSLILLQCIVFNYKCVEEHAEA